MAAESLGFDELMIEAHRVTVALDAVTKRDGTKVTAVPVSEGKRLYQQLRDYQRTAWMTAAESHALDAAMETLRARLKFFGESVGR